MMCLRGPSTSLPPHVRRYTIRPPPLMEPRTGQGIWPEEKGVQHLSTPRRNFGFSFGTSSFDGHLPTPQFRSLSCRSPAESSILKPSMWRMQFRGCRQPSSGSGHVEVASMVAARRGCRGWLEDRRWDCWIVGFAHLLPIASTCRHMRLGSMRGRLCLRKLPASSSYILRLTAQQFPSDVRDAD